MGWLRCSMKLPSWLRRRRFARGGVIPTPANRDDVPVFLTGGRAWMRKPDGSWVEINDRRT